MQITLTYVLSQIFIIINYIISITAYQVKSRKLILILNFTATIATAISYTLLSAYTGLAMTLVAIIRNIIFLIDNRKHEKQNKVTKRDIIILASLYAISISFAVFTYEGIFSLMSVLATMIYTFSIWQKNTKIYKLLGIPVGLAAIIYNIYIFSIFGIIFESLLASSATLGLLKELKLEKLKKANLINNKLQIQLQN